jgi:hypothetical protein
MTKPVIKTPRGQIIVTPNGQAQLIWDTTFQQKWQSQYSDAQMYVDSEILRLSEPFTPLLTSMLIKSGTLGTDIGSGTVQWIAPYARAQYYGKRSPGSQTGPLRGPQWFARMKEIHGEKILTGARRIAGKGTS